MVRITSKEAYETILENGLLKGRQFEVYQALHEHGPCTGNELFMHLRSRKMNQANIGARLGELRDMGCVMELDPRICSVTKMKVIVWQCTSQLPIKRRLTEMQKIEKKIQSYKRKIWKLEKKKITLNKKQESKNQMSFL